MATILKPFRVAFMPDPSLTSNEEFVGHQNVPGDPWSGYDTAEEAQTIAANLNGQSKPRYQHFVVIEIREVQ